MILRFLAYILFGIGFLIILFFKHYNGQIFQSPGLIYFIGFLFFISAGAIVSLTPTFKKASASKKYKDNVSNLKNEGLKINVNLKSCEVISNNYSEEHLKSGTNSMLSYWEANSKKVEILDINMSVIKYQTEQNGAQEIFYSPVISMDKETLMAKMIIKKQTNLYVDRKNRNNYYFDIEFLEA